MTISEYEHAGVKTSGHRPIRIPPQVVCATVDCLHAAEPRGRYCRECRENAQRIEMRLASEPKPVATF